MEIITVIIVSFLSGIMASMGLGGGMVLILYLTLFTNTNQLEAQGINLIFFVPVAAVSLFLHTKKGLVDWKSALWAIISGAVSVSVCAFFANKFNSFYIQKAFAVFIIISGIFQLFKLFKKQKN